MKKYFLLFCIFLFVIYGFVQFKKVENQELFLTYIVDLNEKELCFYWKNSNNENYNNFENLKNSLLQNNKELIFATNGGMYKKDGSPQGLYIENSEIKTPIDTNKGKGNFYLKPNGIFYITKENNANIISTEQFKNNAKIKFATQSGPMLIIENQIHSSFTKGSKNQNIRNGVGILSNGKIVFVQSKKEINFYDFASHFKELGCENALYLDGFVSRTYLPEQNWIQTDGNFGVIIGLVK